VHHWSYFIVNGALEIMLMIMLVVTLVHSTQYCEYLDLFPAADVTVLLVLESH